MTVTWTPLALDAAVAIILLVCFIVSWKGGLVSTLLKLAGFAASLLVGWWASGKLAPLVYERFLKDKFVDVVSQQIASDVASSGTLNVFGGFVSRILSAATQTDASAASETIVDSMLAEPATAVVRAILFILLFFVMMLVVKLVIRLFRGLNKVPVLGGVNKLLGGVVGLAEGLLVCYILVALVSIVVTLSAENLTWLNTELVNQSRVFSLLYNYNPLKAIADSGILAQ